MPGTSSETTPSLAASTKPPVVEAPFDHDSASIIPRAAALVPPETSPPATATTSSSPTTHPPPTRSSSSPAPSSSSNPASTKSEALKQFVADDRHFSLVRNFRLADLVTIGNGICGSLSILCCGNYLATNDREYLWSALVLPLFGMFFDFMDGRVARWRNESSMLGQELDSLADLISFGVAPAMLAFSIGLRTTLDSVILAGFICCGVARLARFNATVATIPKDPSGKSRYFEGLPIPSTLGLVAIMMECVRRDLVEDALPWGAWNLSGGQSDCLSVHLFSFLFAGWGMAMVSKTLRIPKP